MKKYWSLILAAGILMAQPVPSSAINLDFLPKLFKADKPQDAPEEEKTNKKYRIYLNTGGSVETKNYIIEGNQVRIFLGQGTITFNKSEVIKIEEIQNSEETKSVYTAPAGLRPLGEKTVPGQIADRPRPTDNRPPEEKDLNGNTRQYWQSRLAEDKKKLTEAKERYDKASGDWNRYNSILDSLTVSNSQNPSVSPYSLTQYQDLRGAARVAMDKATAEIDSINRDINENLPEEARRAGAPPGWIR